MAKTIVTDKLNVYLSFSGKEKFLAGCLYLDKTGRVVFHFDDSFSDKFNINPLETERQQLYGNIRKNDAFHGLPAIFSDSLPDSWGDHYLFDYFKSLGNTEPTPLEMLSFIGSSGIGAFEYQPELIKSRTEKIVELSKLKTEAKTRLSGSLSEIQKQRAADPLLSLMGGSAGGMRPKFVLNFNPEKGTFNGGEKRETEVPVIVKVPVKKNEEYQAAEFVYSQMAKNAGINIPETWLVDKSFVIKRFDRNQAEDRLHYLSAAGLLNLDFRVVIYQYESLFNDIFNVTHDSRCVEQIFRRMVFNVMAFNCDDHLKNFGFLMNKFGEWDISPAFDIAYSSSQGKGHCMTINGKRSGFIYEDFLKIAEDFEIKNYDCILNQISDAVGQWELLAKKQKITQSFISKVKRNHVLKWFDI